VPKAKTKCATVQKYRPETKSTSPTERGHRRLAQSNSQFFQVAMPKEAAEIKNRNPANHSIYSSPHTINITVQFFEPTNPPTHSKQATRPPPILPRYTPVHRSPLPRPPARTVHVDDWHISLRSQDLPTISHFFPPPPPPPLFCPPLPPPPLFDDDDDEPCPPLLPPVWVCSFRRAASAARLLKPSFSCKAELVSQGIWVGDDWLGKGKV